MHSTSLSINSKINKNVTFADIAREARKQSKLNQELVQTGTPDMEMISQASSEKSEDDQYVTNLKHSKRMK